MRFYAWSMLLYVLAVYDVSWLSFLSYNSVIRLYIILVCFIKMMSRPFLVKNKYAVPLFFLLIYCLYSTFITLEGFYQVINYMSLFIAMTSIIMLDNGEKKYLLDFFIKGFVVILIISLFGWIMYLGGISLPHSGLIIHRNGFHVFYDYYFFRLSAGASVSFFPRFSSIFLEPGQLATPCAFLFFLNACKNKIFCFNNIVLLLAVVFSFSLIGYGLLIFSIFVIVWLRGYRFRMPLTIGLLLLVIGLTVFFVSKEDSFVNQLILSRLEYDDETLIAGNNRTSSEFDYHYQRFIHSNDKYLGVHNRLVSGNDWTTNSSGYQKFIVHFGLIGLSLGFLLIFSMFWHNKNKYAFFFLVILIVAFVVRNLLFGALWLSISILGFYSLYDIMSYQKNIVPKG